jgi:glycosyltransferase involved in cell wall biosynthesis
MIDYARYYGMRTAAVFYDLIPLRIPGYESMKELHRRYAASLVNMDVLFPISMTSSEDLINWWREQNISELRLPHIEPLLLPAELIGTARGDWARAEASDTCQFLMLGTVEPRKNQVAFASAFARVVQRRPDLALQLHIVGHVHPAVGPAMAELTKACSRIRMHGFLPDQEVNNLFAECGATVFVSTAEGFGLPIAESLWRGKPCICSNLGSMLEIARDGGCYVVDPLSATDLERAIEAFAGNPSLRRRLAEECITRPLKSWTTYSSEVLTTLEMLPPLRNLIVVEGSLGGGYNLQQALRTRKVDTQGARWHSQTCALLPGLAHLPIEPRVGDGQWSDQWVLIADGTAAGPTEVIRIATIAKAMGARVAMRFPETDGLTFENVQLLNYLDLAAMRSTAQLDHVISAANRLLPRTIGIRHKCVVAPSINDLLTVLGRHRPRLSTVPARANIKRIYYWCGLTVTQNFTSGVQRVVRCLSRALEELGIEVIPVKWDPIKERISLLTTEEAIQFDNWGGVQRRPQRDLNPAELAGEWLLIPEITIPVQPAETPAHYAKRHGMRVGIIVHDLIVRKLSELYTAETMAVYNHFWKQFSIADIAMPTSRMVATDLCNYLADERLPLPHIVPCPLAGELLDTPRTTIPAAFASERPLALLAVGTWEARKNYPRLLRALNIARQQADVTLTIVGRRDTDVKLNEQIEELAAATSGVTLLSAPSDHELIHLYDAADAVIFGSWEEGFGLPVLESFWRGKPCICHSGSSLVELAQLGGALPTDMKDEHAVAEAIVRLAHDPNLRNQLRNEASTRPIRTWRTYAADVACALATVPHQDVAALPSVMVTSKARPLLSCCITTYNRAPWLAHTLPRLLDATREWRDVVEVVVCDNASTDDTSNIVQGYSSERGLVATRNTQNVGMLGNLGATARAANGAYVWLLGDDDLLTANAIENVLDGITAAPGVDMVYMNYAYTTFSEPDRLQDVEGLINGAKAISPPTPNKFVDRLRALSPLNENLFTAIYACAFRRDHALRAYQQDVRGEPFSSLLTCVPSSVYALTALQDRPAWWIGEPAVVVNMNVSWLRWALLWHLERMPDLYELAEICGVAGDRLESYRANHCADTPAWLRATYFQAEDAIRLRFSLARLLERTKHLPIQRDRHLEGIRSAYLDAWVAGQVTEDILGPDEMFSAYGL